MFGIFKNNPLHPADIQKLSWLFNFILFPMFTEKHATPFCQFFCLVPTPKTYLSLYRYPFFLHIGTHPSKTGEELLYYHLYHEEVPFYLYVCTIYIFLV